MEQADNTVTIDKTNIKYEIILNENTLTINATNKIINHYKKWSCEIGEPVLTSDEKALLKIKYEPKHIFQFFLDAKATSVKIKNYPSITITLPDECEENNLELNVTTQLTFLGEDYEDIKILKMNPIHISLAEEVDYMFSCLNFLNEQFISQVKYNNPPETTSNAYVFKRSILRGLSLTTDYNDKIYKINAEVKNRLLQMLAEKIQLESC
jgi:hypothetical protein